VLPWNKADSVNYYHEFSLRLSQKDMKSKNNIPPSESDKGAEGHGTVVFAGCSDGSMFRLKPMKN